ncbi:ATP-binding protein [Hymenobacter sp. UYCo722]|uniref:ATP-binding protein n=1 Tax=Hymenobacter sp. UYCo722 TaxID=3156335 RepID=UPI0033966CFC
MEQIFAPLYRSDALAHKDVRGTGLGLSIVAKACGLLGVTTSVASELGGGTEFTLKFPAKQPYREAAKPAQASE